MHIETINQLLDFMNNDPDLLINIIKRVLSHGIILTVTTKMVIKTEIKIDKKKIKNKRKRKKKKWLEKYLKKYVIRVSN